MGCRSCDSIKGTHWAPIDGATTAPVPVSVHMPPQEHLPPAVDRDPGPQLRRMKIMKPDYDKHGYTAGCRGCLAMPCSIANPWCCTRARAERGWKLRWQPRRQEWIDCDNPTRGSRRTWLACSRSMMKNELRRDPGSRLRRRVQWKELKVPKDQEHHMKKNMKNTQKLKKMLNLQEMRK